MSDGMNIKNMEAMKLYNKMVVNPIMGVSKCEDNPNEVDTTEQERLQTPQNIDEKIREIYNHLLKLSTTIHTDDMYSNSDRINEMISLMDDLMTQMNISEYIVRAKV